MGDTSPGLTGPGATSVPLGSNTTGRGSSSQNKAAFNWPGREWQEGRSGECVQLDRKNWFRTASPTKQRRVWLSLGSLPKTCGTEGAERRALRTGRTGLWLKPKLWAVAPIALLEGDYRTRDSDGLGALCYPKMVPFQLICKVGII